MCACVCHCVLSTSCCEHAQKWTRSVECMLTQHYFKHQPISFLVEAFSFSEVHVKSQILIQSKRRMVVHKITVQCRIACIIISNCMQSVNEDRSENSKCVSSIIIGACTCMRTYVSHTAYYEYPIVLRA